VFTENILTFPIAYGLALQGLNQLGDRKDYGRINTNLLPAEIRTERVIRAKKPWAAAAAAALLLGTGTMALGYAVEYGAVTDAGIKKARDEADAAVKQATTQQGQETTEKTAVQADQDAVKAIIAGNDNRLNFVRMNEVLAVALPRAGQAGNLNDSPQQQSLWATEQGKRALAKFQERIKAGIPLEKIADDDLTTYLAHVNVESIYTRHVEDVKGLIDRADAWALSQFGRGVGDFMLESESEEVEEGGRKRRKPKGPDGPGWVFQINGYTHHEAGTNFLLAAVVRNFQKANMYAERTAIDPVTKKEKVGQFLTGVTDPVKGNISHVFLLFSKPVDNPQPNKFVYINRNYIDAFAAGGADGVTGGTDTGGATGLNKPGGRGGSAGDEDPGAAYAGMMAGRGGGGMGGPLGGGGTGGWQPLFGLGGGAVGGGGAGPGGPAAGPGGPGFGSVGPRGFGGSAGGEVGIGDTGAGGPGNPLTPGGPGGAAGPAQVVGQRQEKRQRTEFVLCFVWKEPTGGAAPAEAEQK
jgi:hypothetical protein